MKVIKKFAAIAAAGALAFGAAACSSDRSGDTPTGGESGAASGGDEGSATPGCTPLDDGALVGVVMPTKSLERWNRDGADLKKLLEDEGFTVDLQYADNDQTKQNSQVENMINSGAKILVVASIDGEAMGPVLENAASQGITVIAYDRLIKGTEAVDYYASFDNEKVGTLQGEYIADFIEEDGKGPYNIELFSGSPDDNNARFFFKGAYDVLTPYLEDGTLVVPSGKQPASVDNWQDIGIKGWDSSEAQKEMENRLNSFYQDKKVNIVLSPNDSLAFGIAEALAAAGYTPGDDYPVITGQDADEANVQNIIDGKQSMSVWKNTSALGEAVAVMVKEIADCDEVTVNNTEDYNNDVKTVPSLLLDPQVVTVDNVQEILIDSGVRPDLEGLKVS